MSGALRPTSGETRPPSFFQRFLLPGLAFKAVVIGGGYATGRELAEFFLPSGPWGGLVITPRSVGLRSDSSAAR